MSYKRVVLAKFSPERHKASRKSMVKRDSSKTRKEMQRRLKEWKNWGW